MAQTNERLRILLMVLIAFAVFNGLTARLYYLQVFNAPTLTEATENQRRAKRPLLAKRGLIVDTHGRVLAANKNTFTVKVDKVKSGNWKDSLERLCSILNVNDDAKQRHIQALSKDSLDAREIRDNLTESEKDFIESHNIPGVLCALTQARVYPEKSLAATIIGFTGDANKGLSGIELAFNESLKGQKVTLYTDKDNQSRIIADRDYTKEVSNYGNDIVLTIDSYIQYAVERELQNAYHEFNATYVNAVVLDAKSSEVLAIAEYPTYDPNEYEKYPERYRYPRILTHSYEPGSVMKPFTFIAALEQKVISTHAPRIDCENGLYRIHKKNIRDDIHQFGELTPHEILVFSSNIGTVKIARLLGENTEDYKTQASILHNAYQRFGFRNLKGENTTPIAGEQGGILPHPKNWQPHHTSSIPFGQAMTTNTLILAGAYNAIASRGVYRKPQLIKGQRRSDGVFFPATYDQPVRVAEQLVVDDVARMMIDVTEDPEGTGRRVRIPGFHVAGKTGTAQKVKPPDVTYTPGVRVATFAGFFPAQNPEVTIVVMVDEPKKKKYGGEVAGPAWKRIAEEIIAYKGIAPTRKNDPMWNARDEQNAPSSELAKTVYPFGNMKRLPEIAETKREYEKGYMPNLIGLPKQNAFFLLAKRGLTARFEGHGKVVLQEILPGSALREEMHAGVLVCETALIDPNVDSVSDLLAQR